MEPATAGTGEAAASAAAAEAALQKQLSEVRASLHAAEAQAGELQSAAAAADGAVERAAQLQEAHSLAIRCGSVSY